MDEYVPCPKCGRSAAEKLGWSFWGGYLGPRLFHQVKCKFCGTTYNGKTGKSTTVPVILLNVIVLVVLLVIVWVFF